MIRIYATIWFLTLTGNLLGQRFDLESIYFLGKIIKHKKELLYDTPRFSQGFELNILRYSDEPYGWQKFWNHPRFEGSLIHVNFGDKEVLGTATALVPSMSVHLKQWENSRIMFHFGFGVAYVSRKYDRVSNSTNNAIGSNVNNATRFKLRYEHSISNSLSLSLSAKLLHFSNGLSSSPNSGINVFGGEIGISRKIFQLAQQNEKHVILDSVNVRKWGLEIQGVYGASENKDVPGGPKYSVYSGSVGLYWRYKRYLSFIVGVDYEYNSKVFYFFKGGFATEDVARKRATKTSFFIAHECYFGKFSFRNQVGFYLPYPLNEIGDIIHYKTTINFYPFGFVGSANPYLGVQLKTHFFVADYIAFVGGIKF